mgnify:CR=1 FL=1
MIFLCPNVLFFPAKVLISLCWISKTASVFPSTQIQPLESIEDTSREDTSEFGIFVSVPLTIYLN